MSIGTGLAEARYRAGLTVAQVSQQTRIREVMIRAIEQDDYSACGGDFYARGHIRAMARAVGVDPEPLIQEYDVMHGGTPEYSPPPGPDAEPGGDPYGQQYAAPGESWATAGEAGPADAPGAPGAGQNRAAQHRAWQNLSRPDPLYDEPDGYQPAGSGGWEQNNMGWVQPGAGHVTPVHPASTPDHPWESPVAGAAPGWDQPAGHDPGPRSWETPAGNGAAHPAGSDRYRPGEPRSWESPGEASGPPNAAGWAPGTHDPGSGAANWEAQPGHGSAAGPDAPGWDQPSEPRGWAAPAGNGTAPAAAPEPPAWNAPGSYDPVHPPGPGASGPGTWAGSAATGPALGEAPAAWERPPAQPRGWTGAGAAGAGQGGFPGRSGSDYPGRWEDPAPARFGGVRGGIAEPEQGGGLDALFGGDYDEEPDEAPRETAAFAGPPPRGGPPPPPGRPSRPARSRSDHSGSRTQWAAIAALILVAVLGVVAFVVHANSHPNASARGSAGGATQHATAPASHAAKGGRSRGKGKTRPSGSSSAPAASGAPQTVTPLRAVAFGPGGPPHGDNSSLAGLAIDGRPRTDWETDWYGSASFGGLQQGTGLLLVLKHPVRLTDARITVGQTPGAALEVRAGNTSTLAGMPVVAQSATATGVVNLPVTSSAPVRYVLIWFTALPPAGGGHYQADVYNIALKGV